MKKESHPAGREYIQLRLSQVFLTGRGVSMGASETLNMIFRTLSYRSAALDDQIERLKRANRRLGREQAEALHAIRRLTQPETGAHWTGSRARSFHRKRDDAQDRMRARMTASIDGYQRRIESKIRELRMESDFLQSTGSMAREAGRMLDRGEKAADALERNLTSIKRRLF